VPQVPQHHLGAELGVVDDNSPGGTGRLAHALAVADLACTSCTGPA